MADWTILFEGKIVKKSKGVLIWDAADVAYQQHIDMFGGPPSFCRSFSDYKFVDIQTASTYVKLENIHDPSLDDSFLEIGLLSVQRVKRKTEWRRK